MRWLTRGVATVAAVVVLLTGFRACMMSRVCDTEVLGRASGIVGFDFEISMTACSPLAHDLAVSVLVSKAGRQRKTLLFKYVPNVWGSDPTITAIGERTVQISVPRVSFVFCRTEEWGGLTIKYDIGTVKYPNDPARLETCD